MTTVTFTEFRKRASKLISQVERGSGFIILRHGKPVAEISPCSSLQGHEPSWKKPGLRLSAKGDSLSKAILKERATS